MPTNGTITLRTLPNTCWPPSVRGDYATEIDALADSPTEGEIYNIDGIIYYFDGAEFQPLMPPGDSVEVPASAFTDPLSPTQAEAQAWVSANHPEAVHHTTFYYQGTGLPGYPDYSWGVDAVAGIIREIQSVPVLYKPVAIIDIIRLLPRMVTGGENSFTSVFSTTIDTYNWVVTEVATGTILADITGAAGVDASGETLVQSGSYSSPQWAINNACAKYKFDLTVTDTDGNVSDTVSVTISQNGAEADLVFNVNAAIEPNFVTSLSFSDDYVASWDFGDGTVEDSNSVNHLYGTSQMFVARAKVCVDTLQTVVSTENGLTGSIEQLFAGDISQFISLVEYDLSDNVLSGAVPNISDTPTLITAIADNNQLTGNAPSVIGATGLETYSFHNNQLSGELPYIGNNTTLQVFDLGLNNMSGQWHRIVDNTALRIYDIGENGGITGSTLDFGGRPIDQLNGKGTTLEYFDVSGNALTGTPFSVLSITLSALRHFDIADNNLSGTFSILEWSSIDNIEYIDVSNNAIGGLYPSTANLLAVTHIDMSNNLLTGDVRPTATNTLLEYLDFSNNNLSFSALPLSRAANTVLAYLDASNNPLYYYQDTEIGATNGALVYIDYRGTSDNGTAACALFCDIDSAGSVNGFLGELAVCAADPCRPLLIGKGWTLVT